ncbi:50S ribosomal protein L11 methyltransferase [Jeotgalibaca caeni]|uniref:50S ribosomal protein L11 methyltransferase n=1 Tax=Jeotgalibaca caeni TaxID=3028623 RepID=UPI00237E86DE|nr:50S ribosomal protein L11 methyltransferase [Jeotgalibaca caeni]MDE1547881.1 50S ribosomal protein L11 methyltransferase [Jeotgalibaca caeni]
MNWNEVIIITTTEAADATANLFMEVGAKGTAIEDEMDYIMLQDDGFGQLKDYRPMPEKEHDVLVKAYFAESESFADTLRAIREKMTEMRKIDLSLGKYELIVNDVKEEDWEHSWKQYYHPIRITRYLTVVPFWEKYEPQEPDEKLITMDPGMAFGTGTHPTTRLSLEALETTLRGGEKVLDVGTGSGVLSIAAKALGATEVYAFDIDEVATRQSKTNIAWNEYAKDVVVEANNLLSGIQNAEADVIVANILAEILMLMIEDAWNNLKENGSFILSGVIHSKKAELVEALLNQGFVIEQEKISGDWHCFICKKQVEED